MKKAKYLILCFPVRMLTIESLKIKTFTEEFSENSTVILVIWVKRYLNNFLLTEPL
jgi:hypothetical protein